MKPKRIFLDLDDVLNDFTMSTLRSLGCGIHWYDPAWGWDIVRAANSSHPLRNFTPKTFWESLDQNHWATRPKSRECGYLIARSHRYVGRENIFLLSSPTRCPGSMAGKLQWIQQYLPEWMHRQFLIGPPKHLCASPDSLLIDDSDVNVEAFRAHGGQAFLMPRPWNSAHAKADRSFREIARFFLHTFAPAHTPGAAI